MSYQEPSSPPVLSRKQLASINSNLKLLVEALRGPHARYRERVLLRELKGSRFAVFSAIVSRTFGWKNVADIVTLGQFEHGFKDDSGKGQLRVGGLPKFAGTGLTNKTIIAALADLEEDGVIARFKIPDNYHGEVHAFAPMSVWTICETMTARGGKPPPWIKAMTVVDATGKPRTTPLERAFTAYLNRPRSNNDDEEEALDQQE